MASFLININETPASRKYISAIQGGEYHDQKLKSLNSSVNFIILAGYLYSSTKQVSQFPVSHGR
jgi:hypothetical protein